jgi:prepilin-type N-terminal cleavage/methylation domain-containing protein
MKTRHASTNPARDERGFTILESLVALSILAVGLLGLAGVLASGLTRLAEAPTDLIAREKIAEAIENVYASRDNDLRTWAQIRNVADAGVFLGGPQPMKTAGNDGLINTGDAGETVETLIDPGRDGKLGTSDDVIVPLSNMTREITITDVSAQLRRLTVTVVVTTGRGPRTYSVTTMISSYA